MNRTQRVACAAGALLILTASLFPPWVETFQLPSMPQTRRPAGYRLLFAPPLPKAESNPRTMGMVLDGERLLVEYLAITVVCVCAFVLSGVVTAKNSQPG